MRSLRPSLSLAALTIANLMPLGGVLLLGWDATVIVLLYWTENVVIGFYNVLKMALVRVDSPRRQYGKLFAIPFFCLHFGAFCAVHGLFLLTFFKLGDGADVFSSGRTWPGHLVFMQLPVSVVQTLWRHHPAGMEWPVVGLFVSHGVSFVQNYLGNGEYRSLTVAKLMDQPYRRIVVMHVAIIAGGMLVVALDSPVALLCVLVLLKVVLDVRLHAKGHRLDRHRDDAS